MSSTTTTPEEYNTYCENVKKVAKWMFDCCYIDVAKYDTPTLCVKMSNAYKGQQLPQFIHTDEGFLVLTWARAGRLGQKLVDVKQCDTVA